MRKTMLVICLLIAGTLAAQGLQKPQSKPFTVEELFEKFGRCTVDLQRDDALISQENAYTAQLENELAVLNAAIDESKSREAVKKAIDKANASTKKH